MDAVGNDRIFIRLEHPDSDHQGVPVGRDALVRPVSGIRVELDRRISIATRTELS
jgi:hypothetical protein